MTYNMTPLLARRPAAERSFERLYRRHVAEVYRYSLAMLRNPADAEDVTQTTFLNAYRAYGRGDRPRSAQRWLIAIAHNVCRQRFRQSQRRVDEVAYDEALVDPVVSDAEAPSAHDIRRALGHLAFNQRAALVLRELEGRSYAEIADVLGVSASAVETLIFRARRALREQLEGQLSCPEAEVAISRQLDGRLPAGERGGLRAHLRECKDCSSLARKLRAQRSAIKALGLVPLPASLGSFFGGGTAAVGGGLAVKAAGFVAATVVLAGVGHEASVRSPFKQRPAAEATAAPAAAASDNDRAAPVIQVASAPNPAEPAAKTRKGRVAKARGPKARGLVAAKPPKERPRTAAARPEQGRKLVPPGLSKVAPAAKPAVKREKVAPRRQPLKPKANRHRPATPPARSAEKANKAPRPDPPRRPAEPSERAAEKKSPGPAGGTTPGGDEGTSLP